MRLPAADRAVVDPAKIRDYLLSPEHPVGCFKATFFASLGYSRSHWHRLRDDLLTMTKTCEAVAGKASRYGVKYEVRGSVIGPSGREARIVAVWIVPRDRSLPRLVTAMPG